MSRALLGAAVGVGGTSVYYSLPDLQTQIRSVLIAPSRPGPGVDVEGLHKMVEQLAREIRRGQGVTIVNPGGGGSSARGTAAMYLLLLLAAGTGYARFVKGWQLTDLMYVTRGSLRSMEQGVQSGLTDLQSRVSMVRRFIHEQVSKLSARQEEAMAAQEELKEQLGLVGRDVEGTRDRVLQVHDAVRSLEGNLDSLTGSLTYANQGIYVLCKVLGELIQGNGAGPQAAAQQRKGALRELQEYIKNPPALAGRPPVAGLEQVGGWAAADGSAGGTTADGSRDTRRQSSGFLITGMPSIRPDSLGHA